MEPTLTWIDLTASDREKMRRVLDLFTEEGTLDEMGLGSLRDALSDALFPGTSYIQTRLRYVLFVPWIYQRLEARRVSGSSVAQEGRKAEIDLIGSLRRKDPNADGVIGVRARDSLARLPSSLYWSALRRWGIFRHQQSQAWYHTHFATLPYKSHGIDHADDPGVVWTREPNWHPRLPNPPEAFPSEASFSLTSEEADFLQGRLEERCAGTLLGWLARNGSDAPAAHFWDDVEARRAPGEISNTVELARRFSLHVEGMPLLYNLLVAEQCRDLHVKDTSDAIETYRAKITAWATTQAKETQYKPGVLWRLVQQGGGRLPAPQRLFVENWSRRLPDVDPDAVAGDAQLRRLITDRERQLKRGRARLANQNRLLDWRPGTGVGRMDFRWVRVRRFMIDLHRGLAA